MDWRIGLEETTDVPINIRMGSIRCAVLEEMRAPR